MDTEISSEPLVFAVDKARLLRLCFYRFLIVFAALAIALIIYRPNDSFFFAAFGVCAFLLISVFFTASLIRIIRSTPDTITLFNNRMTLNANGFCEEFYFSDISRLKLTPASYTQKSGGCIGTFFTARMTVVTNAEKRVFVLDSGIITANTKHAFSDYERFFNEIETRLSSEPRRFFADLR